MRFRDLLSGVVDGSGARIAMRRLRGGTAGARIALALLSGCAKRPPRAMTKIESLSGPHFAYNSADLTPQGWSKVWVAANALNRYPKRKVEVIGYTDSIGSEEHNQRLSELRAAAV